jgi:hypothetical protein
MYGAEAMLPEEIKHQSLCTTAESIECPREVEDKDLLESDRLKAVTNLEKYQKKKEHGETQSQAKTIRGWESGAFARPSHGEYRKVRDKMDRTLRDIKEDEARHIQAIRHSRKSLRALLECRKPSSFLHLNKNCKRRPHEL